MKRCFFPPAFLHSGFNTVAAVAHFCGALFVIWCVLEAWSWQAMVALCIIFHAPVGFAHSRPYIFSRACFGELKFCSHRRDERKKTLCFPMVGGTDFFLPNSIAAGKGGTIFHCECGSSSVARRIILFLKYCVYTLGTWVHICWSYATNSLKAYGGRKE